MKITAKRNKRILILTSIRINSGSGFRVSALAKYLQRNDYDVIMTGIGKLKKEDSFLSRYISIPEISNYFILAILAFMLNSIVILRYPSKFLFVSKPLPSSLIPALIFGVLFRKRIILDFDDVEHDYWREVELYSIILKFIENRLVSRADLVTTHSNELKKYLIENIGVKESRIWFLPQGVDLDLFPAAGDQNDLKNSLGIGDQKVIVYAAHFNIASRDFTETLQIFKKLAQEISDVILLIIGDGPFLKDHKKYVEKESLQLNVRFTGYVPHSQIHKYFALGDVAVNFLRYNLANKCRASIKIREYIACGLHVVCNELGGGDLDQFKSYINTFSENKKDGFYLKLKEVVSSVDKKHRNISGADFIKKSFSWDSIVKEFAIKLDDLIA